jgi:hypothetical protein
VDVGAWVEGEVDGVVVVWDGLDLLRAVVEAGEEGRPVGQVFGLDLQPGAGGQGFDLGGGDEGFGTVILRILS